MGVDPDLAAIGHRQCYNMARPAVASASTSTMIWSGMIYSGFGAMLIGYLLWNMGLSLGGVARIGQLQYLQVFVTLAMAAVVNQDPLRLETVLTATLVTVLVIIAMRFKAKSRFLLKNNPQKSLKKRKGIAALPQNTCLRRQGLLSHPSVETFGNFSTVISPPIWISDDCTCLYIFTVWHMLQDVITCVEPWFTCFDDCQC